MKKIKSLFVKIDKKMYEKLEKIKMKTGLSKTKLLEILIREIPKSKKWNI